MIVPRHTRICALLLGAFIGGCSSDSSVAPTTRREADLAQVLNEMSLSSLSGLTANAATVPLPTLASWAPSSCSYASAIQAFVCPSITMQGVTVTRSFTLLNAAGSPLSQFDPATTASIRAKTSAVGTIPVQGSTLAIDEQQELTLTGLLTGAHVLDGSMILRVTGGPLSGTGQPLTSTTTMTIANLQLPNASSGSNAWPTGGTITVDMVSSLLTPLPGQAMRMVVAFNGTSRVAVTLTIGGITQRCTMDLASAAPSCI